MSGPSFAVVVPTIGRPSLPSLLDALDGLDAEIVVVEDEARRGPAAARNTGWRSVATEWVVFLDDDVLPPADWGTRLRADLAAATGIVGGVQGRVVVPKPEGRRPTDWERNVAGLEEARWATADMAYRRIALEEAGGFDERFPRAYREDADVARRVVQHGWELTVGERTVTHPVRPASPWVSVRLQRGNADDALMRRIHGPQWRQAAGAPAGRLHRHVAVTVLGTIAVTGAVLRRPWLAGAGAAGWLAGTAELAWARIAPGPRTVREVATMVATSCAIPPVAVSHRIAGERRARRLRIRPRAVLFDRDGTLVHDVPYNGDPERVVPVPGARDALDRLRAAGIRVGVVSNQSGVARGLISAAQVAAVNRRVDDLLGPFDTWAVCFHGDGDGCDCRKPAPGLILQAAATLGVAPSACAVVGDIGSDVDAAVAAGSRPILVPTELTRSEEVARAPEVAGTLVQAVDTLLRGADA